MSRSKCGRVQLNFLPCLVVAKSLAARACVCTCCVPGQWCGSVSFTRVTLLRLGPVPFACPVARTRGCKLRRRKPRSPGLGLVGLGRTAMPGARTQSRSEQLGLALVVLAEVRPSSNQERTSMPCWPQSQGVAHERCCMQELATCFSGLPKSRGPVNPVSQLSADLEFRSLVMVIFKWLPARAFFGNWKLSGNKVSGGCGSVPRPRHLQQLPGHEGRLELGRGPPAIPSR